jgi:hypothetical protein
MPPYRTSGTSAWVRTANTPGSAFALLVSMRVIRACVCPAYLNFAWSWPVRFMSAVYRPSPVTFSLPSGRMKSVRFSSTAANVPPLEIVVLRGTG